MSLERSIAPAVGIVEQARHEFSLEYSLLMEACGLWKPWHVVGKNLILGRKPLFGDLEKIVDFVKTEKQGPLRKVLSSMKRWEISKPFVATDPVRKEDWLVNGVDHYLLEIEDFSDGTSVALEEAIDAIFTIQRYRDAGYSVYIHCKAGRTRSATLVCCILALFDMPYDSKKTIEEQFEEALKVLQERRPQVKVDKDIKKTGYKILQMGRERLAKHPRVPREVKHEARQEAPPEEKIDLPLDFALRPLPMKVDYLFANEAFKRNLLKQLPICKELYQYKKEIIGKSRTRPQRAFHVENLLASISEAKDGAWYAHLRNHLGHADKLINAQPFFNESDLERDQKHRQELMDRLAKAVKDLVCKKLACTPEDFLNLYIKPDCLAPRISV